MPLNSLQQSEIEQAIQRQDELLPGVSRTFALTIPQLPDPLRIAITNAYLLCRIADTIEDDVDLTIEQKQTFHERFIRVTENQEDAVAFANDLHPLLSEKTLTDERILIQETQAVVAVTHSLKPAQRQALIRCVTIMCRGMPGFQRNNTADGLQTMGDMDRYCYFVAGVVGEMLTELFCDYSNAIENHRETMMNLATSFGQGLQMTNILKDVWDDQRANACWLPQEIFTRHGLQLRQLEPGTANEGFAEGMAELIGIARAHLRNALTYTTMIPRNETGIRRFCLWAIGLAVLTLRNIYENPAFHNGNQVKVSRRTVKTTVLATNLACRSNRILTLMFDLASRGLPSYQQAEAAASARRVTQW